MNPISKYFFNDTLGTLLLDSRDLHLGCVCQNGNLSKHEEIGKKQFDKRNEL